jgi:Leucine-rich repeat (LRR) protein
MQRYRTALAASLTAAILLGATASARLSERVLTFPAKSAGRISIGPNSSTGSTGSTGSYHPALGKVTVPEGCEAAYSAEMEFFPWWPLADKPRSLSFMSSWPADGIQGFHAWTMPLHNEDLKYLGKQTSLTNINLGYTKIDDAGLKYLSGLTELRTAQFQYTAVRDNGIKALAACTKLERLNLTGCSLSNRCMPTIGAFTNLIELFIEPGFNQFLVGRDQKIDDRAAPSFANLKKLKRLNLQGTNIGDETVAAICGAAPTLTELNLGRTRVTSRSNQALSSMKHLRALSLDRTAIDDATISQLSGLKDLQELYLGGTNVGEKGIHALTALPSLKYIILPKNCTPAALEELRHCESLIDVYYPGKNGAVAKLRKEFQERDHKRGGSGYFTSKFFVFEAP